MNTRSRPAAASRQSQEGVGLLEVLIAVVILSIGLLGLAALQAKSLATNNTAMARSMATMASYSILDAMRADREELNYYNTGSSPVVANNCVRFKEGTRLSDIQLGHWCEQLGQVLGAAGTTRGEIDCDTSGNCVVTISFVDEHTSKADAGGQDSGSINTIVTKAKL